MIYRSGRRTRMDIPTKSNHHRGHGDCPAHDLKFGSTLGFLTWNMVDPAVPWTGPHPGRLRANATRCGGESKPRKSHQLAKRRQARLPPAPQLGPGVERAAPRDPMGAIEVVIPSTVSPSSLPGLTRQPMQPRLKLGSRMSARVKPAMTIWNLRHRYQPASSDMHAAPTACQASFAMAQTSALMPNRTAPSHRP